MESAADFKKRLIRQAGLSASVVDAAWPDWWSDDAEASESARTELRFSVARKLGLDPRTLLDDRAPGWIWEDAARFKSFRGDARVHQPAVSSFGMALGRMLLSATDQPSSRLPPDTSAAGLRSVVLEHRQAVGLLELLQLAWSIGIPVIHLRVYPLGAKQMSAMSIRIDERFAVFLAKDSQYPAASTFHLAHELGHIFLGHLQSGQSIVDLGELGESDKATDDAEEAAADAFALELLTGEADPKFQIVGDGRGARQLAEQVMRAAAERRIEPGVLALMYGHFTRNWDTATGALRYIYSRPHPVWDAVNAVAKRNISWSALGDESETYMRAVMGGSGD